MSEHRETLSPLVLTTQASYVLGLIADMLVNHILMNEKKPEESYCSRSYTTMMESVPLELNLASNKSPLLNSVSS
jgi:hypothetical protein